MYETPLTGLILTGGGARAAYQVGVLRALMRLRRESGADLQRNPFGVIVGTSAGAINAAALACGADDFEAAVERVCQVARLPRRPVYRADSLGVIRSGAQWLTMLSIGWVIARWRRARPRSLLDNEPLAELLKRMVPLARLRLMLRARHVHGLAVSASSYSSGLHVTFYDASMAIEPWTRSQRIAVQGASATLTCWRRRRSCSFSSRLDRTRRRQPMVRRRLDAPDGADFTGCASGRTEAAGDRCRPHARAAGPARRGERLPEPGADRGPRTVEHLPRRASGRRRTHAGASTTRCHCCPSRLVRRPRCGRSMCW